MRKQKGKLTDKRFVVLARLVGGDCLCQYGDRFRSVDFARGYAKECLKYQAEHGFAPREFVICELMPRETVSDWCNLNAGQRPDDGQLCVHSPAGGARHSAFDLEGRKCAK